MTSTSYLVCIMQAIAEDPEGSVVRAVANSLMNMERKKPGSCEGLVKSLLQQLARFITSVHFPIFSSRSHFLSLKLLRSVTYRNSCRR
jgi:hypothetical protein